MPYHGIRPCRCGKLGSRWRVVRKAGKTVTVVCEACGHQKKTQSYWFRKFLNQADQK